jgi:hypothetical protein
LTPLSGNCSGNPHSGNCSGNPLRWKMIVSHPHGGN